MQSFLVHPADISPDRLALVAEEAHHCIRVLRMREGEELIAIDGAGCAYRARIELASKDRVECRVLEILPGMNEPSRQVVLGVSLLKHSAKFDIVVEKAVELGISAIIPMIASRSETTRGKTARWREIAASAAKQSLRCRIPEIAEPCSLAEAITSGSFDAVAIAHERAPLANSLSRMIKSMRQEDRRRILIMIGPEGGFTEEECVDAERRGARPVSLGPRRLRAETAAIVCATIGLEEEG